jgi:uncharacterized protein with PQ loop repeat
MPLFLWLATLLGSLFTSLVQFFMNYMTKRLAIVVAVVAAISALTFAFFASIVLLVNGISVALPPEFSKGLSLVIPSNLPLCVSSILTAHLIRWVYEWNVKVIQFRLF